METLRAKVLSLVDINFFQFKSKLITTSIFGARKRENPFTKYTCLDEET